MSEQQVHDAVTRLGVGANVSVRISSAAAGSLQYSTVSGRIAGVSATSFDLSVRRGHDVSSRTLAYRDVDELHGTANMKPTEVIVGVAVTVGVVVGLAIWSGHSVSH